MCAEERSKSLSEVYIFPIAIAIAIIGWIGTFVFIFNHDPMLALPERLAEEPSVITESWRLASADMAKEIVNFLTSLTIALAAVAAFFVKDGFGPCTWKRSTNLILTALVAYLTIRSLMYAYDAYGMIAVQLAEGHFFVSRVQQVISKQAQSLVAALFFTAFLFSARTK